MEDADAQYLTFVCAGEQYGVDILRVQEIKGWDGVTRVPYAPAYLLGVMNLRGVIVPVIDLRLRFGLGQRAADSSTVVIVVACAGARRENRRHRGRRRVRRVQHRQGRRKPTPDLGGGSGACVSGLATVAEKMVMLLDIDALVASCIESDAPASSAA